MRLADAVRIRPPGVSEGEWQRLLIDGTEARLLDEPDVPVTYHLAQVHEEALNAWRLETGQAIPTPVSKRDQDDIKQQRLVLAWRLGWLVLASLIFQSWALLIVGTLVTVIEPQRTKH